jgi:hypothetical protein
MKVTHRNGSTFGRIPYAPDWLNLQKTGLTKARSFASTAREWCSGACPHARTRGYSRSAAADSRLYTKHDLIVTIVLPQMLDSNAVRCVEGSAVFHRRSYEALNLFITRHFSLVDRSLSGKRNARIR